MGAHSGAIGGVASSALSGDVGLAMVLQGPRKVEMFVPPAGIFMGR
jgi:hypothetical protein